MDSLHLPASNNTVRVRAIDAMSNQVVDASAFIAPVLPGQETLNLPTMAFLVDHAPSGQRVLFDCGGRRDHQLYAMGVRQKMEEILVAMRTERDMDEILLEAGIPLASVDAMIWSHWHFDHHGAPEKFPPSVDIIVGPRFKELFMPGFPTRPDAILADIYFEGRDVREVAFDTGLELGGFPAVDYFGDGSFYLLDSPGHAIGHMCALARTTPTTFVFLGGDICHSPGVYRPNPTHRLPANHGCACSHFTDVDSPLFHLSSTENTVSLDRTAGEASIAKMLRFEQSPDVLVCIAHDLALVRLLPLLNTHPDADINDWQTRGYKEQARWFWLSELPAADRTPGTRPFVDGKYWRGIKIQSWTEPVPPPVLD